MGDKTEGEGVRKLQERLDVSVQRAMEQQKRSLELISNLMKTLHDMQQQIINNMRG
jgi:hypothetical protein